MSKVKTIKGKSDKEKANKGNAGIGESKPKILYAVFEAAPFMRTGGLGDVGGSLPSAIQKSGAEVRVILPKFGGIPDNYKEKMTHLSDLNVPLGWRNKYCGIETLTLTGVTYYFIDNEYYFDRANPYGYDDDAERVAFFSKAILEALQYIPDFFPDIIHCNDWHTALLPVFLREQYNSLPKYRNIKTVFTVHNLKFQGVYNHSILNDVLGLGESLPAAYQLTFGSDVNYMQGALLYSDRLTTVSETYATEIQSTYYGENLHGVFRKRQDVLTGILNGIDQAKHNPAKDKFIFENFDVKHLEKKALNKTNLQEKLGLTVQADIPLIVIISRLDEQKGLDLILRILKDVLELSVQIAILGVGDFKYENAFKRLASETPDKMAIRLAFDEGLSHEMYAGADMLLMPSKFEPCGLCQIVAMKYGTLPIVRETGGLKDTVLPYNKFTGDGTGFSFKNYNAHELLDIIKMAISIYKNDQEEWVKIQKRAMKTDFSWKVSAKKYIELYKGLINND